MCWRCKPGLPCQPSTSAAGAQGAGVSFSWDLKKRQWLREGWIQQPDKVFWAGDINGDGIGDYILMTPERFTDPRSAYGGPRETHNYQSVVYFLGCGYEGQYYQLKELRVSRSQTPNSASPDTIERDEFIGVTDTPGSLIKSVCVYPKGTRCTASRCDDEPNYCVDLSEWQNAEKSGE
jgi:hypothetical protein